MLKDKRLFLFDIDGTIAIDSDLIEGTVELLRYIEKIDGKAIYITNNSTKSRKDYIEKFKKWNIEVEENDFITASYATCRYLKERFANKKIFAMGTESFIRELKEYGLQITEEIEDNIAVAVVGFDNELNYGKIEKICELLLTRDIDYIATNPDLCCPTAFGSIPDCGAICKMLECAVKREPIYIGKPNKMICEMCLELTGFKKEEALVVGDRLYTDIACGIKGGVETALVLTGEAKQEDTENTEYPPTYVFSTVKELYMECRTESMNKV